MAKMAHLFLFVVGWFLKSLKLLKFWKNKNKNQKVKKAQKYEKFEKCQKEISLWLKSVIERRNLFF